MHERALRSPNASSCSAGGLPPTTSILSSFGRIGARLYLRYSVPNACLSSSDTRHGRSEARRDPDERAGKEAPEDVARDAMAAARVRRALHPTRTAHTDPRPARNITKPTSRFAQHQRLTAWHRRGKTDLVLDGVLRIERVLQELNSTLVSEAGGGLFHFVAAASTVAGRPPAYGSPTALANASSYVDSPPAADTASERASHPNPRTPISENTRRDKNGGDGTSGFENAVLDSMHTSTTESVLQWHHFDVFPSLRNDYTPIFQLEQSRPPLSMKLATAHPYVTAEDVDAVLASFQRSVNFWYPTMSRSQLDRTRAVLNSGVTAEDSIEACLALLTMALGCASQVTADLDESAELSDQEKRRRTSRRQMGNVYFDAALKRAYIAHLSVSSVSAQCLFFVALYFAFLTRPLQAWEYIGAAAAKCMMLLSYPPDGDTHEDRERTRRTFWACYILERYILRCLSSKQNTDQINSDYIAELSASPVSGIARIESSVPLPGSYNIRASQPDEEQSSLYFLACISMRRLLNRVHQLLYASGTGAALDTARFPCIVAELQHQLDEWRNFLPASFAFTVATAPAANAASGFLRQRYLTCRSVIYRPYLMWLLSGSRSDNDELSARTLSEEARTNCKACLDACLMHILNLRGFPQTVLVDTWICSLSMACAMLVLLAACRVPSLRSLIGPDVLMAGDHLRQLLQSWQRLTYGPRSPSVDQGIRIIHEADKFIKEGYLPMPRDGFMVPRRPSDL
ncbi:hypothetical protein TOPH_02821 [Tolypocladium ophioglossoides CBS 100239]|uniref:Xylanolytic transcriptional activator regulatory domain-containing protein n=1 Tax=Tolypocladium ophioglossoides (strain CBS 100239) TaxID=1163406 RepID=A0A0L0NFM2_TOLOC|nr:hypothetical protein TOPH_02821 [Tolypocladium ophioglossoides CBS 100239]